MFWMSDHFVKLVEAVPAVQCYKHPGWIRSAAGAGSSMLALTDGIARAFGRHT